MALIEFAEALGAASLALLGFAGLFAGGAFLQNTLPLGTAGDLLSAGTIPLGNIAVGLAVSGGFAFMLSEFLEQTLVVRRDRRRRR
jgi:multicomponent Na+:H+ antiporter subunit B